MSKITFDHKTIELLKQNPYVAKVSEKSITYSDEFKRFFIDEYLKGKLPRRIFEEVVKAIDDYIDYYNNYRYQWNLKKMTPKQFRNHLLLAA